jgi:hypothetical protein
MADDNSEEQEFDFLSVIKTMLGIDNASADSVINIFIALTENAILNYCHITELPSALNYTLCGMVVDLYRENANKNNSGKVAGSVSSVSEDGRSVSFTNGSEIQASVEDRISRSAELRRFRKLYAV